MEPDVANCGVARIVAKAKFELFCPYFTVEMQACFNKLCTNMQTKVFNRSEECEVQSFTERSRCPVEVDIFVK